MRVSVAQGGHEGAAHGIEPGVAFGVEEPAPFAPHRERERAVQGAIENVAVWIPVGGHEGYNCTQFQPLMPNRPALVRSLGRASLVALVLNVTLGTGVFILPGTVGSRLGWRALGAWILAGLLTAVIVTCAAEVASRYDQAGGPYLYAQEAFGRFVGLQMGWLAYLVRIVSAAVQTNVLTAYLTEFWSGAGTRAGQFVSTTLLLGLLTIINVRGVGSGARTSTAFAIAKVIPLLLFGLAGAAWLIKTGSPLPRHASDPSLNGWIQSLLLLMFAFGGFEAAILPAGEARAPRRDLPVALGLGLGLVILIYLAVQVAVLATLEDPGATNRPIAAAARVMAGETGARLFAAMALVSVYGWMAAAILNVPRLTLAMADRGDAPALLGRIHPVYRTPWISIVVYAGLTWVLALNSTLLQNLSLSAVSRLVTYGILCAALPVLRRREGQAPPAMFRAPAGPLLAGVGILVSLALVTRMTSREAVALALTCAAATVHWLLVRRREP
jgi:amino acid transporter